MTPIQFGSTFHVGEQHIQHEKICQDVAIAVKDKNLIILALSDGMGSYAYAELGARFAVNFIRENAGEIYGLPAYSKGTNGEIVWKKKDGEKLFIKALSRIFQRMQNEAADYVTRVGIGIDDIHCTLSFALIGPTKMVAGSIGDSPLYIKTNEGFLHLYGNGELEAGNITYSAFDEYSIPHMAVSVGFTENLQAVLMMSDGCLGYKKGESLEGMSKDFPSWFYDIVQGKVTIQNVVRNLVMEGYDDCSFSYFANTSKM